MIQQQQIKGNSQQKPNSQNRPGEISDKNMYRYMQVAEEQSEYN